MFVFSPHALRNMVNPTIALFVCMIGLVNAQCVFNDTHCNCLPTTSSGLCGRFSSGDPANAMCLVDNCQATAHRCDCLGTGICERRACASWRFNDPNNLPAVGSIAACSFVPSSSGDASTCISDPLTVPNPSPDPTPTSSPAATASSSATPSPISSPTSSPMANPSPSSSSIPAPSPSSTPSSFPTPSATASPTPSGSASTLPSPSSSPPASPSPSTTGSPSPTASPPPTQPICPGGLTTLNFVLLLHPVASNQHAVEDTEYVTNVGTGQSFTSRFTTVGSCSDAAVHRYLFDNNVVQATLASSSITETPPAGGWGTGYCKLTDPLFSQEFESFVAIIVKADGFLFQPANLNAFDIDNQVHRTINDVPTTLSCTDTVAVFGLRGTSLINPLVVGGSGQLLQAYSVSAAAMTEMGLGAAGALSNIGGGQMTSSQSVACGLDPASRAPCSLTFTFGSPIDTLVLLYGWGVYSLPGKCTGSIYANPANLIC